MPENWDQARSCPDCILTTDFNKVARLFDGRRAGAIVFVVRRIEKLA
jgi:hypothetical protein